MGSAVLGCSGDGPTEPKPVSLTELFGSQLFKADGSTVSVGVLSNTSVIGIYFASPGCPACGGFTPVLVDAYNQLREDGRSFEVVLASAGIGISPLLDYMVDSEMPWLTVSPQSGKANALLNRYKIRWVPTLVIIDGASNTISMTGREEVVYYGTGAYEAWLAAGAGG